MEAYVESSQLNGTIIMILLIRLVFQELEVPVKCLEKIHRTQLTTDTLHTGTPQTDSPYQQHLPLRHT